VFGVSLPKRMLRFLVYIAIAYLLVLVLVRLFESRLIFFPDYPGRLSGDWNPRGLALQEVWITTADNVRLHAWWIPNENAKVTFLAFHGNAGNIADRAPVYEFLASTPANVLALEYRGYGHSGGTPSEAGIYRDADAAYNYLVNDRHIDPNRIVSFGQSLGTAVATNVAAEHQVAGLILEAPFPSAARLATKVFRFLPGIQLLVYNQFQTRVKLQKITVPLLIVHCEEDPVIPFELGQEVFSASHSPKAFLKINGQCHEEASVIAPEKYRTAIGRFLSGLH
jgi:uncharacterized protein